MKLKLLLPVLTVAAFTQQALFAETGDDNPTGVTGTYNGEVTTGCAYDSYTANAKRAVDDIVVPGSVGAYPLKWARYFNSHLIYADNTIGGTWRFSYRDYMHFGSVDPCTPDGRRIHKNVYGVEDWTETLTDPNTFLVTGEILHMADGGKVISNQANYSGTAKGYFYPVQIIDPYGQVTTLSWTVLSSGLRRLDKVTEPGGRYLQINWDTTNSYITSVQAFDGIAGHTMPMQSVTYTWTTQTLSLPDGTHPNSYKVLTGVNYSDGTSATYTYIEGNYPVPCSTPQSWFYSALLKTADDTHYVGPMKQIAYKYAATGNKTRILSENHLVNGTGSEAVSTLTGVASTSSTQLTTETRGDGPQRNFNYYKVPGSGNCAGQTPPDPTPTDGKLYSYTDFQGHITTLTYSDGSTDGAPGFITAVMDANNQTTTYTRSSLSWAILRITHPDGSHIDQTYTDESHPYYLTSRTDENIHRTDYTRDSSNRITRKDYPADGNGVREYETFTYNSFGQTLTHRMKNGAYEHFNYDSRALLLAKTNPTWNSDWANSLASDPQTTFTYYTSTDYNGVWTDRVKTETDPRGLITQYDYDRTIDGNGENSGLSTAQTPVGGRGLVTRITHVSDSSNYQSFGFDKYGNKDWQEDELRDRTSYIYDDYRRVLTIKNPLNKIIVTNTYTPTNGTNTSSYVHTTNSIYTMTTPTGIVTQNIYDPNFRKTSTTQGYGTSIAATTQFIYDVDPNRGYTWVGSLVATQDPKGNRTGYVYDTRNRKITEIDPLTQTTQWFYDGVSNVNQIVRKDGTSEIKHYDQMNRVIDDTVPQTSTINVTTTFKYYPGNVQYGGLMKQVIDADGHITTFTTYDPSGLKNIVTYPNGDTHVFGYDNDHNLTTRQTANTTIQNFTYDNRNRKSTMYWTNPNNVSNFTAEWESFGYDAASRLTSAQNGSGSTVGQGTIYSTITRQYDAASRLILDRQNLNATLGNKDVQYSYDDDGKDTRLYLTSAGYDYTFSYDAMGRFQTISPTGGSVSFQYKYDAASNEAERDNLVNSVNQFYSHDALNRMSERDVKLNTTVLSSEAYGYDPMSRMLSTLREDGKTDSFTYYLDGELWTANYGAMNRSVTYNIDQMGNRTSVVDTGVTTTYTQAAGGLNQYGQVGTNTVGNGSEHEIALYQNIAYGYVNDERLASVSGNGHNYALLYDALGRCVKRTLDNATTFYIYDGEKPIAEYNSAGGVVARNLYGKGIDEILMRIDATLGTFYYQDDHEGSVTHLTSAAGAILERYRYDVFGTPSISDANGNPLNPPNASAYNSRFMFTGREYTSAFGIYEYRARAYHPGLGRFTGEDPKGFDAGDYNLFRYCHNDPEDLTDPMGLDATVDYDPKTQNVNIRLVLAFDPVFNNADRLQFIKAYTAQSDTYGRFHATFRAWQFGDHWSDVLLNTPAKRRLINEVHTTGETSHSVGNQIFWNRSQDWDLGPPHEGDHASGAPHSTAFGTSLMSGDLYDASGKLITKGRRPPEGARATEYDIKNMITNQGRGVGGPSFLARVPAGMTYAGHGYFTNGQGMFTNQKLQTQTGNYGSWDANHYGATQSSPFDGDAGQFSQLPPHIP
jgi:RHS repeat-associated protein